MNLFTTARDRRLIADDVSCATIVEFHTMLRLLARIFHSYGEFAEQVLAILIPNVIIFVKFLNCKKKRRKIEDILSSLWLYGEISHGHAIIQEKKKDRTLTKENNYRFH